MLFTECSIRNGLWNGVRRKGRRVGQVVDIFSNEKGGDEMKLGVACFRLLSPSLLAFQNFCMFSVKIGLLFCCCGRQM